MLFKQKLQGSCGICLWSTRGRGQMMKWKPERSEVFLGISGILADAITSSGNVFSE